MEDVPGAGVGVGLAFARLEPPPPQPVERASAAIAMHANKNLITGANVCWGVWCFICMSSPGATKFCRGSLLSLPSNYLSFLALVIWQPSHLHWNNFLLPDEILKRRGETSIGTPGS
jgi:hypothetical protein